MVKKLFLFCFIAGCTVNVPLGTVGTKVSSSNIFGSETRLNTRVYGLASDGKTVYWTASPASQASPKDGAILSAPASGGAATVLAPSGYVRAFAADDESIYWGADPYDLKKVSKKGGDAITLAVDGHLGTPSAIATDAKTVFYAVGINVARVEKDGTGMRVLAKDLPGPVAIAVDDVSVYFLNNAYDHKTGAPIIPLPWSLMKVDKNGGAVVTLASGLTPSDGHSGFPAIREFSLAVDATDIYWANLPASVIMKLSKSGGDPVVLASGPSPLGLTLSEDFVYFASLDHTGQSLGIVKVAKSGGPLSDVANARAQHIALDGESVYWTQDTEDLGIFKARK